MPELNAILPKRASLGRLVNQSTMLLMGAIGTIILVLALLILFHQNANATKGYTLRTLERERNQLQLDQEILSMKLSEQQSIDALRTDGQVQMMLPPKTKDVTYLEL